MKGKKLIAVWLSAAFCLSAAAMVVPKKEVLAAGDNDAAWNDEWNTTVEQTSSGQCGSNLTWRFEVNTGILAFSGDGSMWSRSNWKNTEQLPLSAVKGVQWDGAAASIGEDAFSQCINLTGMTIPESVTSIGHRAFDGCGSLAYIALPKNVTFIGAAAFRGCTGLPYIVVPESVTTIGSDAFEGQTVCYEGTDAQWRQIQNMSYDAGDDFHNSVKEVIFNYGKLYITSQPANVTAKAGDTVQFSVKAVGNGLTYQWHYKKAGASAWSMWKGHTTATTSAPANATWNGMKVYCAVTDGSGQSVKSNAAVITIAQPPVITSQPANVTAKAGDTVQFSVKAVGNGLTYQWYYKKAGASAWSLWKGHTTATTSAPANATWNGMKVYCAVTDGSGQSVKSNAAVITIVQPPVITSQPSNVTAKVGDTVKFSVKAAGSNLTYQWYYQKAGASAWSLWKGHTTPTTYAPANATWNGMKVYCAVTDGSGQSVQSNAAVITIVQPPVVTSQPSNVTAKVGDTVKFSVKATGSNLTYQWYYKKAGASAWSLWKGHTTATTSAPANATWNGMKVYCDVTDGSGQSVKSNAAVITVQ